MKSPHRVDRMEEIQEFLLNTAHQVEDPDVVGHRCILTNELAALCLMDISNSIRVWLYGPEPNVEVVPDSDNA